MNLAARYTSNRWVVSLSKLLREDFWNFQICMGVLEGYIMTLVPYQPMYQRNVFTLPVHQV